ncbi:MAG TPA: radical SAM family heme chaperone HemW [Candidatus Babeliales bacterium]|nr:radical SAM family heme chaperone HemW [Candidatus Babeliales bacterium]
MYYDISSHTRSLYIHWPFCPYRCHYCPFVALASHDPFMERYHNALTKEIQEFGSNYANRLPLNTIYFGGGTPSTYPDHLLRDMFATLNQFFIFDENTEITFEVNPGTVRFEQLSLWKELGINRISIGVQSLNDSVLHKLNRLQKATDVYSLLDKAPSYFDNISVDVILGLPGISMIEWKELLAKIVTWNITHISMYILEVHDSTPLFFNVSSKKVILPCDDEVVDAYYWSREFLINHNFNQYEISSFAKTKKESRHNSMYWERLPYRGFGLGACSFDGTSRLQNEKNLIKYLESIEQNKYKPVFTEIITKDQIYVEKIMLGLRRTKGVCWEEISNNLTVVQKKELKTIINTLQKEKLIIENNGRLQLTPAGLVIENEIITRLAL